MSRGRAASPASGEHARASTTDTINVAAAKTPSAPVERIPGMDAAGDAHDREDGHTHHARGQQVASGCRRESGAQRGRAQRRVAKRHQPVDQIQQECPSRQQRATDVPVVEHVEHRCGNGEREPAADGRAWRDELGEGGAGDRGDREIASGTAREVFGRVTAVAMRGVERVVDDAHRDAAERDETRAIVAPIEASIQRIGYAPRSASAWKPVAVAANARIAHRKPECRRSESRSSRDPIVAASAIGSATPATAAGSGPSTPDSQNRIRPASQSDAKRSATREPNDAVPVAAGTAVSAKPVTAANPNPNIISCACQTTGPPATTGTGSPNARKPAHSATAAAAYAAAARNIGRNGHMKSARDARWSGRSEVRSGPG